MTLVHDASEIAIPARGLLAELRLDGVNLRCRRARTVSPRRRCAAPMRRRHNVFSVMRDREAAY
jgi:hypothetical protein